MEKKDRKNKKQIVIVENKDGTTHKGCIEESNKKGILFSDGFFVPSEKIEKVKTLLLEG